MAWLSNLSGWLSLCCVLVNAAIMVSSSLFRAWYKSRDNVCRQREELNLILSYDSPRILWQYLYRPWPVPHREDYYAILRSYNCPKELKIKPIFLNTFPMIKFYWTPLIKHMSISKSSFTKISVKLGIQGKNIIGILVGVVAVNLFTIYSTLSR
jgi:hypothetical protein